MSNSTLDVHLTNLSQRFLVNYCSFSIYPTGVSHQLHSFKISSRSSQWEGFRTRCFSKLLLLTTANAEPLRGTQDMCFQVTQSVRHTCGQIPYERVRKPHINMYNIAVKEPPTLPHNSSNIATPSKDNPSSNLCSLPSYVFPSYS